MLSLVVPVRIWHPCLKLAFRKDRTSVYHSLLQYILFVVLEISTSERIQTEQLN